MMQHKYTKLDIDFSYYLDQAEAYTSLNFKISGVPKGVKLSAGTHKGHGTWKLSADEIQDVSLITPQHYIGNVDIHASVIAKDAAGRSTEQHVNLNTDVLPYDVANETIPAGYDTHISLSADTILSQEDVPANTVIIVHNLPQDVMLTHAALHPEGVWSIDGTDLTHVTIFSHKETVLPPTLDIQKVVTHPITSAETSSIIQIALEAEASLEGAPLALEAESDPHMIHEDDLALDNVDIAFDAADPQTMPFSEWAHVAETTEIPQPDLPASDAFTDVDDHPEIDAPA